MVVAALIAFAILLVAWILAPAESAPATVPTEVPLEPEALPEAA
jgi:hypothetical protein